MAGQQTQAAAPPPAGAPEGELVARIEGAAGVVTLNRPRALNALTSAMRAEVAGAFAAWSRDPQVYAALIVSASERAFASAALPFVWSEARAAASSARGRA